MPPFLPNLLRVVRGGVATTGIVEHRHRDPAETQDVDLADPAAAPPSSSAPRNGLSLRSYSNARSPEPSTVTRYRPSAAPAHATDVRHHRRPRRDRAVRSASLSRSSPTALASMTWSSGASPRQVHREVQGVATEPRAGSSRRVPRRARPGARRRPERVSRRVGLGEASTPSARAPRSRPTPPRGSAPPDTPSSRRPRRRGRAPGRRGPSLRRSLRWGGSASKASTRSPSRRRAGTPPARLRGKNFTSRIPRLGHAHHLRRGRDAWHERDRTVRRRDNSEALDPGLTANAAPAAATSASCSGDTTVPTRPRRPPPTHARPRSPRSAPGVRSAISITGNP